MAGKQAFTPQQVITAITQGHTPKGASVFLGCHPDTVRNYARRYATVKRALLAERQDIVDLAEIGLRAAVVREESWAIAFALKTLARDTYSERHEITGAGGKPISLKWENGDNVTGLTSKPVDSLE